MASKPSGRSGLQLETIRNSETTFDPLFLLNNHAGGLKKRLVQSIYALPLV